MELNLYTLPYLLSEGDRWRGKGTSNRNSLHGPENREANEHSLSSLNAVKELELWLVKEAMRPEGNR